MMIALVKFLKPGYDSGYKFVIGEGSDSNQIIESVRQLHVS